MNHYLVQIQELADNLEEYKTNLRKQIEINRELEENISFYRSEEETVRNQLHASLSRIENVENVIRQAAEVIREILSVGLCYTFFEIFSI